MSTLLSAIETKVRQRLLEPAALATPGAITVSTVGTPGLLTWTYVLVALNATGTTEAGPASSIATGAATLNGTNYNHLTWTAIPGVSGYWIYRTVSGGTPSTLGRIAVLGAVTSFDDQGSVGDLSTAPILNSSGLTSPFWTSDELIGIMNDGIKDLWRDIVDLKQEHYLTIDNVNVSLAPSTSTLSGVPSDVHKVYLLEPVNIGENSGNVGLIFKPLDYNHRLFMNARSSAAIDPSNDVVYYAITGQGGPTSAPTIYVAPQVTGTVPISFSYVPTLTLKTSSDTVPIPGEADNALVSWTVAYARAKERDDRSPDPSWLTIYATEKQHLLESLGQREYQEPQFVDATFEEYW